MTKRIINFTAIIKFKKIKVQKKNETKNKQTYLFQIPQYDFGS